MPCWTSRVTEVELDAKGVDLDRMVKAAQEHEIIVERINGRIVLRDYQQRSQGEVTRLVKQSYARATVEAGLRKFGFKTKTATTEQRASVGQVLRLTVGR